MFFFNNFLGRLQTLMTSGPLAAPLWIAFVCAFLWLLRAPLLNSIFHLFRVEDEPLRQRVRRKLDAPMQLFLVTLAFTPFAFLIIPPFGPLVVLLVHVLLIFLIFHIAIQAVDLVVFSWYFSRKQAGVSAVVRVFALTMLYGLTALLVLDWGFGVSVLPLLATSTVITAVLGLALQDTLRNTFAGLNMSLEHSFEEGDWVMFRLDVNDQYYGQIVEIGWRTTKIKTLNNNYAIIPNAQFTNHELINFNRPSPTHGRTVEIPVSIHSRPQEVAEAIIRAALKVEGVLPEPLPDAYPMSIKPDHVVYQLRFWLNNLAARESLTGEVLAAVWAELQELGALGQSPTAL